MIQIILLVHKNSNFNKGHTNINKPSMEFKSHSTSNQENHFNKQASSYLLTLTLTMAPNGELFSTRTAFMKPEKMLTANEGLQRAISDLSFQLRKESIEDMIEQKNVDQLPAISEVEDAKCECCGMSEECTPEYISRVRDKFSGKWICGLCSEAVKEEAGKNGGKQREALDTHMNACVKFNRFGRTNPVLGQAEAMREMLRRNSRGARAKSTSPKDHNGIRGGTKTGIARSSSCIPSITKDIIDRTVVN